MKNDPYFKYLALIILAGLVLAFLDPAPAAAAPTRGPDLAALPAPPVKG